jgi:uridine kinase
VNRPPGLQAGRRALLRRVADLVPSSAGADCVRVGVDGVDGSGKSMFADELAEVVRGLGRHVVRVAADDFHNVRAIRHRRGRSSPAGFWLDSYNYERLRADVLDPLGTGGSREYRPAAHDLRTDEILSPPARTAPPGAVLILDGLFLHRDELAGVWDLSIFLDVPFDVTAQRMAGRDGTSPDPRHPSLLRYVAAQEPRTRAPRPL